MSSEDERIKLAIDLALTRRELEAAQKQTELLVAELEALRTHLQGEIVALHKRLNEIESRTGMLSPNPLTRAFAVWGNLLVAQVFIGVVIVAVYLIYLNAP